MIWCWLVKKIIMFKWTKDSCFGLTRKSHGTSFKWHVIIYVLLRLDEYKWYEIQENDVKLFKKIILKVFVKGERIISKLLVLYMILFVSMTGKIFHVKRNWFSHEGRHLQRDGKPHTMKNNNEWQISVLTFTVVKSFPKIFCKSW